MNNLNVAEEKLAEASAKSDVSAVIGLQGALKFNGGGHINHSIFWKNLCSKGEAMGSPDGELAKAIDRDFGSFDAMKEKLSASTVAVQVVPRREVMMEKIVKSFISYHSGIWLGMARLQ